LRIGPLWKQLRTLQAPKIWRRLSLQALLLLGKVAFMAFTWSTSSCFLSWQTLHQRVQGLPPGSWCHPPSEAGVCNCWWLVMPLGAWLCFMSPSLLGPLLLPDLLIRQECCADLPLQEAPQVFLVEGLSWHCYSEQFTVPSPPSGPQYPTWVLNCSAMCIVFISLLYIITRAMSANEVNTCSS